MVLFAILFLCEIERISFSLTLSKSEKNQLDTLTWASSSSRKSARLAELVHANTWERREDSPLLRVSRLCDHQTEPLNDFFSERILACCALSWQFYWVFDQRGLVRRTASKRQDWYKINMVFPRRFAVNFIISFINSSVHLSSIWSGNQRNTCWPWDS